MSDEIFEGAPEPMAPPLAAPEDIDLGDAHIEREQQIAQAGAVGAMRKKYPHLDWDGPGTGTGTADATPEKPTQRPGPSGGDPPDVAADLVASMGRGSRGADEADEAGIDWSNELYGATIGAPNQALGGALDAAKETGDMAREFNDWVTENVGPVAGGGIIVDEEGLRFASGDEIQNTETFARWLLPDIERADSVTGGLVRGISQFLTGFMGAGKIKALKGISNPLAQATARGAVADFSVFDPHEDRLSDLIQQYPAIANPVSEFLSADPGDSAAEGRLKSAVEGLGFGLATEVGLRSFRALVTGLKTLRAMRQAKGAASEAVDPLQGVVDTAERRREELTELIGDPEAPRVEVRARGDFGDLELERSGDAARDTETFRFEDDFEEGVVHEAVVPSEAALGRAELDAVITNPGPREVPEGFVRASVGSREEAFEGGATAWAPYEEPLSALEDALYSHPDTSGTYGSQSSEAVYFDVGLPDSPHTVRVRIASHDVVYGNEPTVAVTFGGQDSDIQIPEGSLFSPEKVADLAVQKAKRLSAKLAADDYPAPTPRAEASAVKGAAIRLPDGTIVEGVTHGEAMAEAQRRGILADDFDVRELQEQGAHFDLFATTDGRLVDRFEASSEFGVSAAENIPRAEAPVDMDGSELVDLDGTPVPVNTDGTITVYHRTSAENAARIEESGRFVSKENTGEAFFSTRRDGQATGYGDTVVELRLDPSTVRIDDAFHGGEVHLAADAGSVRAAPTPRAEASAVERVLHHASDGPMRGDPDTSGHGFYLSETTEGATRGAAAGGYLPMLDVRTHYPDRTTAYTLSQDAKIHGQDLSIRGVELPETLRYPEEFNAKLEEIARAEFSSDARVNNLARELAREQVLRFYHESSIPAEQTAEVLRKTSQPMQSRGGKLHPVPEGNPAGRGGHPGSLIPWDAFEHTDTPYADALRALGFDVARVGDEGGASYSVLNPGKLAAHREELAPTPRAEAPAVAEAREAVEAIKRMKVAELREAGLMPEKGGRKRDLLEEAEKRLEEAEQLAKTEEPAGGMGTEEAAQAVAGARAVPDGGASAAEGSGEVFINWARIDSVDDVKAVMQDMADASAESIDVARRGVRSWEQTRLDAESIEAWDMLMERRTGEPLNAEQSVAARELWAQSGAKLRALGQGVVADPGSEMARIAFRRQLTTHNFIQEATIAARTEIARALNAWKMPAGDSVDFSGQFDQLREMAAQDKDALDIASRLVALSDAGLTKEADAFLYGTARAKGAGMIRQLWYFSLLSGPHTHMRNMISNTATIGLQIMERKAASVLGRALGEQNIPDGETAAMTFGVIQGFKDAFRISAKGRQVARAALEKRSAGDPAAAKEMLRGAEEEFGTVYRSLATGQSGFGVGKVETPPLGAFDPERLGIDKDNPWARVASYVDTVTRAPGTALMVEDEIFKSINYRAELNAQAHRQASKELNSGQITKEGFKDRLTELVNDPTEALRLEARDFAQKGTFTNTPLDTGAWKSFSSVQKYPVIGRIIMPFRRTAYNIAIFSYQRTPLAPLTKQWRDDLMAGGARTDLAWSKFLVGNAILASFADLAMSGHVSGEGPSSPGQRAHERRMNRAPYSVRVHTGGDPDDPENYRNFSYRGLEPIAFHLGVAANIVEILEERDWDDDDAEVDELIIVASMAIANQVTSANFMSGVSGFFEMMSDSRRYGERWTSRLAGAAVPTGIAQVGRGLDPTSRAIGDWVSQIRSRTPVLSKDLPANRDVWGRKIDRSSGLGTAYDFMSPLYSSQKKIEPIDRELERLELWLNKPGKVVSFDGVKVNLRNHLDVWSRYVELSGNALKETEYGTKVGLTGGGCMEELNALVGGDHPMSQIYGLLSDGPEGGKADQIRQIQGQYREAARDQLLEEFPWLKAEVEARESEKATKWDMETLMQGANR